MKNFIIGILIIIQNILDLIHKFKQWIKILAKRNKGKLVTSMPKKYIVYGSNVVSKNDGGIHFITANKLIHLHRLNPKECICIDTEHDKLRLHGIDTSKMIHVYPDYLSALIDKNNNERRMNKCK